MPINTIKTIGSEITKSAKEVINAGSKVQSKDPVGMVADAAGSMIQQAFVEGVRLPTKGLLGASKMIVNSIGRTISASANIGWALVRRLPLFPVAVGPAEKPSEEPRFDVASKTHGIDLPTASIPRADGLRVGPGQDARNPDDQSQT